MKTWKRWSRQEISLLRRNYPHMTINELANKLGRSYSSVASKIFELGLRKPWRLNTWEYKEMNKELAYVLGVYFGDGSIRFDTRTRTYHFRLEVKDLDFALATKKALEKLGLRTSLRKTRRGLYLVICCSKSFTQWLRGIKVEELPKLIQNKEDKISFIRGFFDSDGSLEKNGKGGKYIKMFNKNKELLQVIKRMLEELGFHPRLRKERYLYVLGIYRNEEICRFVEIIGSSIPRKRSLFHQNALWKLLHRVQREAKVRR